MWRPGCGLISESAISSTRLRVLGRWCTAMTEHGPPPGDGSFARGPEGPWPSIGFPPWRDALRRVRLGLDLPLQFRLIWAIQSFHGRMYYNRKTLGTRARSMSGSSRAAAEN